MRRAEVFFPVSVPLLSTPREEVDEALIPLFEVRVAAGFPSPAEGTMDQRLNLHSYLVERPAATFFLRVAGDSMSGAGIFAGDLLVVDRAAPARDCRVVVASVDGEFVVKRLRTKAGFPRLEAAHPDYPPIELRHINDFRLWGVVRHAIHTIR